MRKGGGATTPYKVLVVDDEEGIRNLLDALLSRKDYAWSLPLVVERGWNSFGENVPMSWC